MLCLPTFFFQIFELSNIFEFLMFITLQPHVQLIGRVLIEKFKLYIGLKILHFLYLCVTSNNI